MILVKGLKKRERERKRERKRREEGVMFCVIRLEREREMEGITERVKNDNFIHLLLLGYFYI